MSTQTGTATSYLDLLSKLRTFLTTDATLVAAGQNWTELATNSTPYVPVSNNGVTTSDTVDFETYLKAPGLSGSESIYINIRAYHNTASDYYNWEMRGAQGYNATSSFWTQPGTSSGAYVYLWNSSIPYWFIANGQRVIVIAKISTVYESLYLGKFLPYGTPGQYPYPVAVGGSGADADRRFSDTSRAHSAFFDPVNMQVCRPDNSWEIFQNWNSSGSFNISPFNNVWPWQYYSTNRPNWMSANADGTYAIFPAMLRESNTPNLLGELDGVGFVTGNANGSENTVNDGTNTWLVVQDTFRTAADNYGAVKLA